MSDCLFCKIVAGEIPSHVVYENEHTLAFLDIKPVNKGHTLVIPKKHSQDYLDTTPEVLAEISRTVQHVTAAVVKGTNVPGFNIHINNGRAAGQVIFHSHWHIIPRFEQDGHREWPGESYDEGEAESLVSRIRSEL